MLVTSGTNKTDFCCKRRIGFQVRKGFRLQVCQGSIGNVPESCPLLFPGARWEVIILGMREPARRLQKHFFKNQIPSSMSA